MDSSSASTSRKALKINLDESIYGTFAEIGAGQEVARHFFQAGKASATVAKTISAYDMTFSDAIYGKDSRYVCESRLDKMLTHEFDLLTERLNDKRGESTRFFAFANTVTTSTRTRGETNSHGWLGIRFQLKPKGPVNDIILHVRLWDQFRLQQQEALGRLGVNLISGAYNFISAEDFIRKIQDDIESQRIEVDLLRFKGKDFEMIDNRISSLELVRQGLTEAVIFDTKGNVQLASEMLYEKDCLVLRGTFRPITNTNLEILEKSKIQFQNSINAGTKFVPLFEMTMHSLMEEGQIDKQDFLDRVDTLAATGHPVMVSNFFLFYQLKVFLRTCTKMNIGLVIGASHLEKLFDEIHYKNLPGGILEGFSRLFDSKTELLIFPYKTEVICMTAASFHPDPKIIHLFNYLKANKSIKDISDCDDVNTSIHSDDVRKMLASNNKQWENLVPKSVSQLIKTKHLFGYS